MGIGGLGMGEMILIFLVVLLLFGAKKLPEIGSSLGKGIREFKNSVRDIERGIQVPDDDSRDSISSTGSSNDDDDGEPRSLTSSS